MNARGKMETLAKTHLLLILFMNWWDLLQQRETENQQYIKKRVLPWLALVFATPIHLMLGCIVSQTLKHRSHPSIESCH